MRLGLLPVDPFVAADRFVNELSDRVLGVDGALMSVPLLLLLELLLLLPLSDPVPPWSDGLQPAISPEAASRMNSFFIMNSLLFYVSISRPANSAGVRNRPMGFSPQRPAHGRILGFQWLARRSRCVRGAA